MIAHHVSSSRRELVVLPATVALAVSMFGAIVAPSPASSGPAGPGSRDPELVGRAVLPVETYAGPPASGAFVVPGPGVINGITFPLPGQPVQGFSAIVSGRHRGEVLAMPDNGFGGKANSVDFLIRAYYLHPDFKTAKGGTGEVDVGDFISFRDPDHLIGFPIVNEDTPSRLLTGGTSIRSPCSGVGTVTSGSATSSDLGSCTSARPGGCWNPPSRSPAA